MMIRKQTRQRRDYIYRRALALKDAAISEKRAKLRASLASGKPLDAEVAGDKELRKDYQYDESKKDMTADEMLDLDDEYHLSGVQDPRVVVTTSRNPSSRLSTFSKEIRLLFPTATRINRGNMIINDLVKAAQSAGQTDLITLHEKRGTPTALIISHMPHGPTAKFALYNVVLRGDIPGSLRGTVSEQYPRLIFDGFTTKLGDRVVKILKNLFPPRDPFASKKPKAGGRVITFKNIDDFIELRHHVYVRTGYDSVELSEAGPRMTLKLFELRQGTVDNENGDIEWQHTQYTRTGRKKNYL